MVDSSFPLLALDSILLSGCIAIYLAISFMKDILFTSKFGQFWKKKKLIETSICSCLCGHTFSTPLRKCQASGLLDHIVEVCWVLEEITKLSSKVSVPCSIPTSSEWEFCCSTFLQALEVSSAPEFSHSSKCVLSRRTYDVEHLCTCFFATCISSLVWCLLRSLALLVYVVSLLSFKRFVCVCFE